MAQRTVKSLGSLCDILDSKRKPVTKRDRVSGDYPYYGATGIVDYVDHYIFDEPLVLIGEDGAKWGAGENTAFSVDGKCWVNNHAHVIRPHRDTALDKWIIYYLNASDLSPFITGLTVPKLNQEKLREIPVPLPPLSEQKRIVAILDEAFEGIDTAVANTKKNLANARELFDGYLNAFFNQRDETWAIRPLVSLCSIFVDSAHRTPHYQEEGIPALRPRDLVNGQLNLSSAARVSEEEYEAQSRRHRPISGDIVYSRELSYGWAALLPQSPRVCLSQGMCIFRPSAAVDSAFLLYVLNGPIGREQAMRAAVGAAHPHINLGDIKSYSIPLPPLDSQRQLVRKLDQLQAATQSLQTIRHRKLTALADLKQAILHKAFSGELTAHPEKALPEAAE
jgi:type I restriction enzyme S subunit